MLHSRMSHDFPDLLDKMDLETLETSKNTAYALDSNLNFVYFNPQYVTFAVENNAIGNILETHPIGSPFHNVIKGSKLKNYYLENYERVLSENKTWINEHECSSHNTFRMFLQRAYPIKKEACILIVNSLVRELPMENLKRKESVFNEELYVQSSGFINQCSNCRRSQRTDEEAQWDWIPDLLNTPQLQISHTICPICFDFYWKYHKK